MSRNKLISTGYTDLAGHWHSVEQLEAEAEARKKKKYSPPKSLNATSLSQGAASATPEERLAYLENVLANTLASYERYESDGSFRRWPSLERNYTDYVLQAEEALENFKAGLRS